MIGYIKNYKTYKTTAIINVYDYEINEDTTFKKRTKINAIMPKSENGGEGDFVILPELNYIGILSKFKPENENEKYKFECDAAAVLFDRDMLADNNDQNIITETGLEDFIAAVINREYVNNADEFITMPFLSVTAITHTPSEIIIEKEFNLLDFINDAANINNVIIQIFATNDKIEIQIRNNTAPNIQIDMANKIITDVEESFSNSMLAKLVVYAEDNQETKTYYLNKNGTYTETQPITAERAEGNIKGMTISKAEKFADTAAKEFSKNKYSHLIEFSILKDNQLYEELNLYDNVILKTTNNRIFKSFISGKTRKSNTNIINYKCGELRNTLTANIAQKWRL